jgi:hypothetical protein
MNSLTKKYRLIWDVETKILAYDPYIEYSSTTEMLTNSLGWFESDLIQDVEKKIDDEGLVYVVEKEQSENVEEEQPENDIDSIECDVMICNDDDVYVEYEEI